MVADVVVVNFHNGPDLTVRLVMERGVTSPSPAVTSLCCGCSNRSAPPSRPPAPHLPARLTIQERRVLGLVAARQVQRPDRRAADNRAVHRAQAPRAHLPEARRHQPARRHSRGPHRARPERVTSVPGIRLKANTATASSAEVAVIRVVSRRAHDLELTMYLHQGLYAIVTTVVLTAALATTPSPGVSHGVRPRPPHQRESAQVILDWERILMQTVYPSAHAERRPPPRLPPGAVHDAVLEVDTGGQLRGGGPFRAAHDVLVHYFPASSRHPLDGHLATSLAAVPDVAETDPGLVPRSRRQRDAGQPSRGRLRRSAGSTTPSRPAIGIWQPVPPATDMLAAWLGSLEPMVLKHPVAVNGPDPLTSRRYAADYDEVRRLGGTIASGGTAAGTRRTPRSSSTAIPRRWSATP